MRRRPSSTCCALHEPDDAVTGEESGHSGEAGARRRWLVDPLCGTLNYAARTMLVAVNVALQAGADTTAAAAGGPVLSCDGGLGPTADAPTCAAAVPTRSWTPPSPGTQLVDVNLDPPFPNAGDLGAVRLLADPGFTEQFRPRVVSTTLALAWVAAGRRAAYVTDGHLRDSVHFAAGIAGCLAAGCVVSGIHGQPLHTGAGGLVVAADHVTHAALVELIGRQTA